MRIIRPLAALAVVALVGVAWPATAQAATLTVGPGGGSGPCLAPSYSTVQDAVTASSSGDTIVICPGTYALASTIANFGKNLVFEGSGADVTILDGQGAVKIMQFGPATVTVRGLTFTRGFISSGGAAISSSGALTIEDSVFTNNVVSSNNGGAVFANDPLTIVRSTFTGNSALGANRDGGAVYASDPLAEVTIQDSVFTGNAADRLGGAVMTEGPVTITGSTFSSNAVDPASSSVGGAVWSGSPTVTTSSFIGNQAYAGGALASTDGGIVVSRSTFSANSATVSGGAVRTVTGPIQAWNSTFSGNTAGTAGGALYTELTAALASLTLVGNSAPAGSGVRADFFSAANVIFADETLGQCLTTPDLDWNDGGGNLTTDGSCPGTPVDVSALALGSLGDNGGPTQTVALGSASVAIDAGVDDVCTGAPDGGVDQRGFPRPVGGACDSGAYEAGAAPDRSQLPPPWLKAIGRATVDGACPSGTTPSWAEWPNNGRGGVTCEWSIVYNPDTGRWEETAGFATS